MSGAAWKWVAQIITFLFAPGLLMLDVWVANEYIGGRIRGPMESMGAVYVLLIGMVLVIGWFANIVIAGVRLANGQ